MTMIISKDHLLIAVGVMGDLKLGWNQTTLSERTYDLITNNISILHKRLYWRLEDD